MSAPIYLAQDPASDRLTAEDVIEINKLHIAGTPWDDIAQHFDIDRRHVRRIVQGRRWAKVHPANAPELYSENVDTEPRYTREQVDEAFRAAYKAFIATLTG